MASQHGLGRGLSSLIPQKNIITQAPQRDASFDRVEPKKNPAPEKQKEEYKKVAPALQKKQSVLSQKEQDSPVAKKEESIATQTKKIADDELRVEEVSIGLIAVNSQQPRLYFNEERLAELTSSIEEHGILQPLTVIPQGNGYELIAGERRLRASKEAGLKTVPVIVRDAMSEQKKLELAIIENVQRHDLNVVEEAKSYAKLAEDFDLSQEEIAQKTGKSRSVVANRMRLIKLPVEVQRGLIDGKISEGHAKVILSLENPEKQRALFDMILTSALSVRDAERAVKSVGNTKTAIAGQARSGKSPNDRMLEDQLSTYFETKVSLTRKGKGGDIRIQYFSEEEIKNILSKLKF